MVLPMRGLMASYLLFALLATATPIGQINSPIIRIVHVPEMAKLIPRAPPPDKRRPVSPLLGSDAKRQSTGPDPSAQPEIEEIPRLADEDSFQYATRRADLIRDKSGVGQIYTFARPEVVKWINDLSRDMSTLGLSNDERAKLKHDMFPKFLEVRGKVAKWEGNEGKEQAKSALIHWKEAMFENCPKRAATDTEVSYITKQLVWIKEGLTVHVLQEEAHIIMATYLSILFQDITWFLSIDIKALFPPPQTLFLDMGQQTFDVEGTSPTQQQLSLQSREHVKGLGKMLALAFTVLWAAKTKVAEWGSESSTAKALLRSAIMELEMALDDVKNDEKVTLKKVRRLLKEVDQSHPGNIFVLQNLIVGLTRARITELMTMKSELDSAYASRRDKAGLQYVDPNETPLKQWMGLRTLLSDKK